MWKLSGRAWKCSPRDQPIFYEIIDERGEGSPGDLYEQTGTRLTS